MHDLISVVLPVRNGETHLSRAVAQLASLTYPRLEVVIVDDGSAQRVTRESVAALDSCGHTVKVLRHEHSAGVAAARNRAVAEATGEWVWFVDVDDQWAPDIVSALHAIACATNVDMVVCGAERVSPTITGRYISRIDSTGPLAAPKVMSLYLSGAISGHLWNKLFRMGVVRAAGPELFPRQRAFSDSVGFLRMLEISGDVAFTPDVYYKYFTHSGSILNSSGDYSTDLARLVDQVLNSARVLGLSHDFDLEYYLGTIHYYGLARIAKGMDSSACKDVQRRMQRHLRRSHLVRHAVKRDPKLAVLAFVASRCLTLLAMGHRIRSVRKSLVRATTSLLD